MVAPSQLPIQGGVPPPPVHSMYHGPPQQHRTLSQPPHRSGYPPHGYPPGVALSRYGPMHSGVQPPQQQHNRVHSHHQNHHPSGYRVRGGVPHHPFHHPAVINGPPHGMLPPQHPHCHPHQYPPPRSYMIPSSSSSQHPPYQGKFSTSIPHGRSSTLANVSSNGLALADGKECENEVHSSSSKPMHPPPPMESKNESLENEPTKSELTVESSMLGLGKVPEGAGCFTDEGASSVTCMSKNSEKECIDPSQSKKEPASESKDQVTGNGPSKKTVSMQDIRGKGVSVMSPITMCFERMLGAAEVIQTPGSALNFLKKRGPFNKKVLPLNTSNNIRSKRLSGDGELNPFDELLEDPDLERLVILQMAMQRNQHFQTMGVPGLSEDHKSDPNTALFTHPKREISRVITEGFFWREYPACEQILYNHMQKYYEISAIQKNYKVQQYFNNVLVEEVRKAAEDSGFTVDPDFCDKKLRDRIRCFYKTHLQNAKKRLATLQKHADSFDNQCLVAVFIRCVRNPDLTFEDSLAMANTSTELDQENVGSSVPNKKRKMDKIEKLKSLSSATTCENVQNKTLDSPAINDENICNDPALPMDTADFEPSEGPASESQITHVEL